MAANDKNLTPFWLKWLVLGFIMYAGYLHFTGKDGQSLGPNGRGSDGFVTAAPANLTTSPTEPGIAVPNDILGTGDPAVCGQTATVRLKGRRSDGQPLALPDASSSVAVGVSAPDQPWMQALPGMRAGGVREIALGGRVLTPEQRTALKLEESESFSVMLTLESLTPTIAPGELTFLATDLQNGTGEIARCGRTATLHLTLWGADGKVRYSSREAGAPLTLVIGQSPFFYGLDRTLVNMRAGGVRRAVVPPAFLAAPTTKDAPALEFPRDQVLIADVQLLTVTDTK
jgi:FKBP-type peptidyl-prolyl cis-trans isomerase